MHSPVSGAAGLLSKRMAPKIKPKTKLFIFATNNITNEVYKVTKHPLGST